MERVDNTFVLHRTDRSSKRTLGVITYRGEFVCDTLELPWKNNAIGKSSIPAGVYPAVIHKSPKFGRALWLQDTGKRTEILIHPANYVEQLRGCIAPGTAGKHNGEDVVWSSRKAMDKIIEIIRERFIGEDIYIRVLNPEKPPAKSRRKKAGNTSKDNDSPNEAEDRREAEE